MELWQELISRTSDRKSLQTLGRATYFGKQGRVRLRMVVVAQRPGAFRIETLTPFEQPIDVMTSNGEDLWLISGQRIFKGPATADNISKLLPIPMTNQELVSTLLGGMPVSSAFKPMEVNADGDLWKLVLDGPGSQQGFVWVEPEKLRVRKATLSTNGNTRVEVEYSKFQSIPGAKSFAQRIKVKVPRRDFELSIRLQEPELNRTIDQTIFQIELQPGSHPEPFDAIQISRANES